MPHALSFFLPSMQGMDEQREKRTPAKDFSTISIEMILPFHAQFPAAAPNFAWRSRNKIKIVVHTNKSP